MADRINWTELIPINAANLNNIEDRIDEALQNVIDGKTPIANALVNKGQVATVDNTFAEFAQKIEDIVKVTDASKIVTGNILGNVAGTFSATALPPIADQIAQGKEAWANGIKITGTRGSNVLVASGTFIQPQSTFEGLVTGLPFKPRNVFCKRSDNEGCMASLDMMMAGWYDYYHDASVGLITDNGYWLLNDGFRWAFRWTSGGGNTTCHYIAFG